MKTGPLFVVAAVLLAVACAVWAFTRGEPAAPGPPPPQSLPFADWPIAPADGHERHALETEPASAPESPVAEPSDLPPAPVDPWLARFLVVDDDDAPVADAVVTLRESWEIAGRLHHAISEHVLLELHTDLEGRAQTTLRAANVVADARKGATCSGLEALSHTDSVPETTLRVDVVVTVRGIVLRADGLPAAGAKVIATASSWGRRPGPQAIPSTAGPDGRFDVQVPRGLYNLMAEQDGGRTFLHSIWCDETPPEVTLTFPGASTIEGVVVDVDGKPVASALLRCRREAGGPEDTWRLEEWRPARIQTDQDGRFRIAVAEHARYELLAQPSPSEIHWQKHQANSRWHAVETTAARPHAQVRLQLLAMATIRGRVERDDGSPLGGTVIGAEPEAEPPRGMAVDHRFPPVANVHAGGDGDFELAVHPDTTWTVFARPSGDRRMEMRRVGVRPGDEGVVMRLTEEDLRGCIVQIAVVRADGKPADMLLLRVTEYRSGKPQASIDAGTQNPATTRITLSRDRQYTVLVEARPRGEPVAPALVGPFWTDRAEVHLAVRLELWGEVPVRVLDASGAPARRMSVSSSSRLDGPGFGLEHVDEHGCVVLKGLAPGPHTLRILPRRGTVFEHSILVQPGPNPDVVVRLPAGK